MGKYTILDENVDAAIEGHLSVIKKVLIEEARPISIILFGGFGKGEGSVEIVDGKITPFNDYDLYLVTRKKLSDKLLDELTVKTSRAINKGGLEFAEHPDRGYNTTDFFHVDIRNILEDRLSRLNRTQRTFELKYGSQVIWGDESVIERIPAIGKNELPLSEGIRNLFNKIHTLLLCMDPNKLAYKELDTDERKIIMFYTAKAYLSISEALLISCGRFEATYSKRVEAFQEIYETEFPRLHKLLPDLKEKVKWARDFKVKLDFHQVGDPFRLWFKARDDIGIAFKYLIKTHLGLKSDDWEGISAAIYNRLPFYYFNSYLTDMLRQHRLPGCISKVLFPTQYYLNVLYTYRLWKKGKLVFSPLLSWRDVGLRLAIPMILYLFSMEDRGTLNQKLVEVSRYYFGKTVPQKEVSADPLELRIQILDLYGAYCTQRLV